MQVITIQTTDSGRRLDRYLERYLSQASKSFIYKMLRKKNIVLNDRKAAGNEILEVGDEIKLWMSDETIAKFSGSFDAVARADANAVQDGSTGYEGYPVTDLDILYEDEHVILINKPAGMLSQKARQDDVSLCEYLIGYLLSTGQITPENLRTVRPSVCNRLDRNTSGIVCCGKSAAGLAAMSGLLRTREVHKYYQALVMGRVTREERLEGYIQKDEQTNVSSIVGLEKPKSCLDTLNTPDTFDTFESYKESAQKSSVGKYACTIIRPLEQLKVSGRDITRVEAELITGRSHQIRSQLADAGHVLVGDIKYASSEEKAFFIRQLKRRCQLLHCERIEFPRMEGPLEGLSEKTVRAALPKSWGLGTRV